MPIKLPSSLGPLLSWSRNDVGDALQRRDCPFNSNIETAVFVACYGFYKSNGELPPAPESYLPKEPILAGTYQNKELFGQILCMAIAATHDTSVINDEERLCRIFEALADHGARKITEKYPAPPYDQEVLLDLMRDLPAR
jgi:hypothetical protein